MDKQAIFEVIVNHTYDVVPSLNGRQIHPQDALHLLGANSIDRSEIIMMTLESLELDLPLIEAARANTLGDLADIMLHGLERGMQRA
ncbi:MAG: acyl carrier protein [Pseudomonadota bacterium]|jgi:polyketide biosynthesis acyl carrier protein